MNLLVQYDTDGWIDRVFFFLPAAAQDNVGHANLLALNPHNKTSSGTADFGCVPGAWEKIAVIYNARIAALAFHHLAKFLECLAGGDQTRCSFLSFLDGLGFLPQNQHPSGEFQA